jgi:hypothetical protein
VPGGLVETGKLALGTRLRAELPAKLAVWLGLAVGICVPYFALQRFALLPARALRPTALDGAIAFDPHWIAAYLSLALLVPLAPLLAADRDALARYARGLAVLCLACFAVFLLFPVAGPRPLAAEGDHALYRWLVGVDRPTNSLPSLHAGLTVYSLLFAARALRGAFPAGVRRALFAAGALWGAAILYSTLATKQHWALDLPPGVLLAAGAHALAWRSAQPDTAARRERSATKSVQSPTPAATSDRY